MEEKQGLTRKALGPARKAYHCTIKHVGQVERHSFGSIFSLLSCEPSELVGVLALCAGAAASEHVPYKTFACPNLHIILRMLLTTLKNLQVTAMDNSCCVPLDLFSNKFIANIFTRQDSKHNCPTCGEDNSQNLADAIITTLRQRPMSLSFSQVVTLRAAFWSLADRQHGGYLPDTCFNIVEITESNSGILATVRTMAGEIQHLSVSKAEFLEMVTDPTLEQGSGGQIWVKLTAPLVSVVIKD